jgi:predicted nucleic acid-binding protein
VSASRLVCDASAVVTVLLDSGEGGNWLARQLAGAELCAPVLLPFECANVIRRHELRGLISSDQAAQAHADLIDLPMDLFPYEPLAQRVWQLRRNLTSYDAASNSRGFRETPIQGDQRCVELPPAGPDSEV